MIFNYCVTSSVSSIMPHKIEMMNKKMNYFLKSNLFTSQCTLWRQDEGHSIKVVRRRDAASVCLPDDWTWSWNVTITLTFLVLVAFESAAFFSTLQWFTLDWWRSLLKWTLDVLIKHRAVMLKWLITFQEFLTCEMFSSIGLLCLEVIRIWEIRQFKIS